jgi:hypothetical protein
MVRPYCRTGLAGLDEATDELQGMTILAGPEGCGRSALALYLTRGAMAQDPRLAVLYISLSLDLGEQNLRLLAMESGVRSVVSVRAGLPDRLPPVCGCRNRPAARRPAAAGLNSGGGAGAGGPGHGRRQAVRRRRRPRVSERPGGIDPGDRLLNRR